MCGISGFVGQRNDKALHAMNAALVHRGPDGEGTFSNDDLNVHLAHRRLAVIDLAGGHQPMASADGQIQVIFNGEIYNQLELRKELTAKGHVFLSDHSDTEVLVHGFEEWGLELALRLSGMFAFAILDQSQRRLVLGRDRFGKKPLYYTQRGGFFAFASEISALLCHPSVTPRLDELAIKKFFAYGFIPSPRTQYAEIEKLPGGCVLSLDLTSRATRLTRYWKFGIEAPEDERALDEGEVCEQIRELLSQAVEKRVIADVPLGVFLSGGIDSSAILKFAASHIPGAVSSFSIGFKEKSFDETPFIEEMVKHVGSNHSHEIIDLERAKSLIFDVLGRMDEPLGDPSILPTYLVSQMARKNVTVALSGDGGDELFAGYDPFKALKFAEIYQRFVPKPMHLGARLVAARLPLSDRNMSWEFKINRALRGVSYKQSLWNPVWLGALEPDEIGDLFQSAADPAEIYSEAIDLWDSSSATSVVDKTLEFYTNLYLTENILMKSDRAGMINSLEIRSPFLDNELVEFARRLPHRLKLKNGVTKYILKKSLNGVIPETIIHRKKKGFGIPIARWLREFPATARPRDLPVLDQSWQDRYWQQHCSKTRDYRHCLWNLISLSSCLKEQKFF